MNQHTRFPRIKLLLGDRDFSFPDHAGQRLLLHLRYEAVAWSKQCCRTLVEHRSGPISQQLDPARWERQASSRCDGPWRLKLPGPAPDDAAGDGASNEDKATDKGDQHRVDVPTSVGG
jgi:hypothetical protein